MTKDVVVPPDNARSANSFRLSGKSLKTSPRIPIVTNTNTKGEAFRFP
jgi:hypothetical protein